MSRKLMTGVLLLVSLACAAPAPLDVMRIVNNPAAFKPTSSKALDTDSGIAARQWIWGKAYSPTEVRVEMLSSDKKAWLWQTSVDTFKTSSVGKLKKLVKFDSGLPYAPKLTAYAIASGPLKGNYLQVWDYGEGNYSTAIFSPAYLNIWAKGPEVLNGNREVRGYFPVYPYLNDKKALCSRDDFTCF